MEIGGEVALLGKINKPTSSGRVLFASMSVIAILILLIFVHSTVASSKQLIADKRRPIWRDSRRGESGKHGRWTEEIALSEKGVVAADDGRCSEIGASIMRQGGHAVDSAVATALCVGVVNPSSSGIGGGAFMVVWSPSTSEARAFDMRETAPLAARQDMYESNPASKISGALSVAVPGELAGLYEAWRRYGRIPWESLFKPAIHLAGTGFEVRPYLASVIAANREKIEADTGLRKLFAPQGRLLRAGDVCYNPELARTLAAVAERGPGVLYDGPIGEKLVSDLTEAGGILTMDDLKNYRVHINNAMAVDATGYTVLGMPPPSSGTLGLSLVLHILESFGMRNITQGPLSLHRLVEAMKHMLGVRMNLGDPNFVNITRFVDDMLSPSFAREIRKKISDYTTFSPDYYMTRWSQLRDHGTSHFCVVDGERNAVSMTTTVNYAFGSGVLSLETGIILNNEMDDFSTPEDLSPDHLPPSPANFITPNKRPLSSMTPIVVLKERQLAGVIGGSGGMNIIAAVVQVFINHYILGIEPLAAVRSPRVYHRLIPNVVKYENLTLFDGHRIELSRDKRVFLVGRGHVLEGTASGAMCQLVVHQLTPTVDGGRKSAKWHQPIRGILTAVSDARKDGKPAAV